MSPHSTVYRNFTSQVFADARSPLAPTCASNYEVSIVNASVSLSPSLCLCLSVSLSLSVCLSVSVFVSVCLPACLPACLSVCLPACLSACLPACLPVCLPACLSVCLSLLPLCLPLSLFPPLSLSMSPLSLFRWNNPTRCRNNSTPCKMLIRTRGGIIQPGTRALNLNYYAY